MQNRCDTLQLDLKKQGGKDIMSFFKSLIGEVSDLLSGKAGSDLSDAANTLKTTFTSVMRTVMPIVFSVILAFGVFFSIKLGIYYAKQETTEKREEAKKRLVGAVVGFGIGIVAAVICWVIFTNDAIIQNLFK